MLTRSAVATASALCILGWLLIIGFTADAQDRGADRAVLLVIFGRASGLTGDPSTGEAVLQIDDGSHTWSCAIGNSTAPEAGTQVIACCAFSPGHPLAITRIVSL